jgi:hypothetical protein
MACSEWKVPCEPVKPWVMTLVEEETRMDMGQPLLAETGAEFDVLKLR